jgi:hypothetical protein
MEPRAERVIAQSASYRGEEEEDRAEERGERAGVRGRSCCARAPDVVLWAPARRDGGRVEERERHDDPLLLVELGEDGRVARRAALPHDIAGGRRRGGSRRRRRRKR